MPTFSEMTITFTNDWVELDDLKITTSSQSQTWDFVFSRSGGFEVTVGVPTGNAGETSAINFEAAFEDLGNHLQKCFP